MGSRQRALRVSPRLYALAVVPLLVLVGAVALTALTGGGTTMLNDFAE